MRLGTSGLGVIAVVSLLVTAAAERDDIGGVDRGSGIDNSRSNGSERSLMRRYSRLRQVATETSSSGFVKIEFESLDSTSPKASRQQLLRPSVVSALELANRKPEIPTTLARFSTEFATSRRALVESRNFEKAAKPPDVRSASSSSETTLEGNGSPHQVDSSMTVYDSASRDLEDKLVTGDITVPSRRRRRRRDGREARKKETTEVNNGQAVLRSTERTMSGEAHDALHLESLYVANYSVMPRVETAAKVLTADGRRGELDNHQTQQLVLSGKIQGKMDTALNEESLVREEKTSMEEALTVKSMVQTLGYSSVTEEISQPREITSESSLEMSTIEGPFARVPGNTANTSGFDVTELLDNHKAPRVGSFPTVQQPTASLESPLLPARLPHGIPVKDTVDTKHVITGPGIERPAGPVNQLAIPKSAYAVAKNTSNPSINLVDGKARKKYYEIKPSLITEMDHGTNLEVTTTPRRTFDKFLLPSVPSAFGKFGPFFLDEEDRRNVTERIGNTVQLDCRIGMLGHRKVTWLQHYKDSFRLLTVERESYSVDRRISLNFQYPDNWRLQIAYASLRDSGLYKCQVEIDQDRSLVKRYNVIITAPTLTITDDSGRPVSGERHLKAGSALKLRCEARDVIQRLNESVLWMRGDATLTQDVSENRTLEMANEKEINVVVSTLLVEGATPKHAGNYSCVVPEKARTTIAVHVLNGELPAAVQHNSAGVSTAVLNLWVVHLTASYGFFR